ncbi:MAG: hypothetical protein WDZ83_03560 [Rhizobiaceae bacterium]
MIEALQVVEGLTARVANDRREYAAGERWTRQEQLRRAEQMYLPNTVAIILFSHRQTGQTGAFNREVR